MKIKLLHIGLGKCGSVFLENIFKEVEKKNKIKLINLNNFFNKKKIITHVFENKNNFENELPNSFIISNRSLFSKGWEFNQIFRAFEYIKKNFSRDTTILIVIRNPYELINSIYCQSIQVMDIKEPKEFFYLEKNNFIRKDRKFNLYGFDYNSLISLYKSYFDKVVVVKYENIHKLNFLKKIFDFDDEYIEYLRKNKNKRYNRTISKNGIRFILFLNKFIDLNKYQRLLRSNIKRSNNFLYKIKNRVLYQFLLREFFQKRFDKLFTYKKYYIDKDSVPMNLDKLIKDYNDLKF